MYGEKKINMFSRGRDGGGGGGGVMSQIPAESVFMDPHIIKLLLCV